MNESITQKMFIFLNREIIDGEPGNDSYDILKFWPILSLVILIKRILIKKRCISLRKQQKYGSSYDKVTLLPVVLLYPGKYLKYLTRKVTGVCGPEI